MTPNHISALLRWLDSEPRRANLAPLRRGDCLAVASTLAELGIPATPVAVLLLRIVASGIRHQGVTYVSDMLRDTGRVSTPHESGGFANVRNMRAAVDAGSGDAEALRERQSKILARLRNDRVRQVNMFDLASLLCSLAPAWSEDHDHAELYRRSATDILMGAVSK